MNESKSRLVVEIDTANAKRNADEVGKALNKLSSKGDKAASTMVEMSRDVKTTATANSQLKTEVDKSTKALSQNTEVSKRNSNALRELAIHTRNTLLASTALAGGVGGLTTVLGQAATDIDRYSKLTQMSTDEFQYFALGAAKAGYSMDSYAMALKDVFDRLGDVTDAQSGEMMDFFTNIAPKVGLTSEAFKDLSGQEALQLYYNSLKQLNLPHAEMVKYMEQLIDDGSLLIPMLENNGAGFKKYGDEAQRAGAIMSGELINGLNEVNANLNSVKIEALGFANTIAGHVLPAVKLITANLDTLATVGGVIAALYGGRVAAAFALSAQKTAWNTAALVAQTSATNAATVAARGLYTALGGPVGLVVSIATVAAGYLMMRDSTEAANDAMEANARYSAMATSELIKLEGAQKRAAQGELADSVDDLSTKLKVAQNDFKSLVEEIYSQNKSSKEAQRIWAELTTNVIDADEALNRLNKLGFITPQQINSLTDGKNKIDAANQELKQAKIAFDAVGNAASGGVGKINDNTNALQGNENAARNAANALHQYAKAINNDIASNAFAVGLKRGGTFTDGEIDILTQFYNERRKNGEQNARVTADDIRLAKEGAKWQAAKSKAFEETTKSSTKATRESTAQQKKAVKDLDQSIRDAESLIYDYTSEFIRIETDLNSEIARINGAALKPDTKSRMIADATEISEARKKLYAAELDFELNQHKMSDAEKLKSQISINKLRIDSTKGFLDDERTLKKNALDDQQAHELALIKLAQETRIFYMKQALMTESEAIRERYRLERDEIAKTQDSNLRSQQMTISILNEGRDTSVAQQGVAQRFAGAMGVDYSAEKALEDRRQAIIQYREWFDMSEAEFQSAMLANQSQFERDKQSLALGSLQTILAATSATWSQMTQLVKDGHGEQSSSYKAMYAMQQIFAASSATVSALLAYNQVLASPWLFDPISKQTAAAVTLASGMASVGMILGQTLAGFSDGGFTGHGGKYEPAGIVHKGEGVLNQEEIRAIGGEAGFNQLRQAIKSGYSTGGLVKDNQRVGSRVVNSIQQPISTSKAESISIQNHITIASDGNATTHSDSKQLGEMINQAVIAVIRREKRQGGLLA